MRRVRHSYVLIFCGIFFLFKFALTYILDESRSFEVGRYCGYLMDLLNYLPVGMLIYFFYSSPQYRHERIITSACLILINMTFPLVMEYSAIVFSFTQQNIAAFGNTPGIFSILVRYILFILFFLLLAFLFYKKNLLAESKLTLFVLLTVFLTNLITVIIMLVVGHSINNNKEKFYRHVKMENPSGD